MWYMSGTGAGGSSDKRKLDMKSIELCRKIVYNMGTGCGAVYVYIYFEVYKYIYMCAGARAPSVLAILPDVS